MQLVGRKDEIKNLEWDLQKSEPQFIAIYGRRTPYMAVEGSARHILSEKCSTILLRSRIPGYVEVTENPSLRHSGLRLSDTAT